MPGPVALRYFNRHDPEKRIFMVEVETDAFLIGRGADCAVVLDDEDVSRHHARMERVGSRWVITDLKSTNGTVVDGVRVRRAPLVNGSSFRLGDTMLELRDRTAR